MISFNNRTVWLTGASSGIGYALAERLLKLGATVIVTARRQEPLEALRSAGRCHIVTADVGVKGVEHTLRDQLTEIVDSIDTVIINAGTCEYVDIDAFDVDLVERVNSVNYMGFVRCVGAALPLLKQSGKEPHLVGVSSAAAYIGLPRSEAYGASKAAMRHFLQALRLDLKPAGITTSIIYPGFVDTPLTRQNDFSMPFLMTTDAAVDCMVAGMEQQKLEISFPRRLIWPLKLLSFLPAGIASTLGAKMVREN
ncbi:MAG: SDR family NAD(P)-dependent oxidoreductase [Pseudomonadota bacterium]